MSGVAHDLTLADVESGQWVRAVSRHTSGAEQTLYGPVTEVSGMLLVASWSVYGAVLDDWTLVSCERVDPPRPAVPTGRNAVVRLNHGMAWRVVEKGRVSDPWLDDAGDWQDDDHITDVIWPGESE